MRSLRRASKKENNEASDSGRRRKTTGESRARIRSRSRLISAAEAVMARRGVEGSTIQEITEAADVGIGTFYNHFSSKNELARAVFESRAEELASVFDQISRNVSDPARRIAYIQRTYIQRSIADTVWGWFQVHAESALQQMEKTFFERAKKDILDGVVLHRFTCGDCIDTAVKITLCSLVATTKSILEDRAGPTAMYEVTELMLRMYGVPASEAATLARESVPDFEV
ncbi:MULTISPECIES: TetR/AcrR family transcriptional regulator [Burkholderia cepacia complex]|uniref:TetR/AcrR family transcriptional regulator n=1 Tax=Burkholderia cepacia complex TaxID=87882 RepID=UPI0009B56EA1|nr:MULTISPECIES: TetR/AcrR family transcriptional regulator [Burkholderia cepacia complex]